MRTNTRGINLQVSHHLSVENTGSKMLKHLRLGSVFLTGIIVFQQRCHPSLEYDELEKLYMNINDQQRREKKHHH